MRFREFLRHFQFYFIISAIVFWIIFYLRARFQEIDHAQFNNIQQIEEFGRYRILLILTLFTSFILALLSSAIDEFILRKILHKRPLGVVLLIGSIVQILAMALVLRLGINLAMILVAAVSDGPVVEINADEMGTGFLIMGFALVLSRIFIEIDRKLGPGNLRKLLLGRFYKPREEDRLFMFIDMQSSTQIAEKLGHFQFSHLIQDAFSDFAVVHNYRAEIYQYVGDEVVISWPAQRGIDKENFMNAYFAFLDQLEKRKDYYLKEFGLVPFFKAGANSGAVVVTEVGERKREITYHGDTLNTAARIQGMCNEFNAPMLIPEEIYQQVSGSNNFNFEDVGSIPLRGKKSEVKLYKVTRK